MKKVLSEIILFTIIFMFVLTFFQTISFADYVVSDAAGGGSSSDINPDTYKTTVGYGDASYIFDKGGKLLKIVRNIAAIVSVVTISIIGLRYMLGSVDQKAEYKEKMRPVVIGCILVAALSTILTLIQSIF